MRSFEIVEMSRLEFPYRTGHAVNVFYLSVSFFEHARFMIICRVPRKTPVPLISRYLVDITRYRALQHRLQPICKLNNVVVPTKPGSLEKTIHYQLCRIDY